MEGFTKFPAFPFRETVPLEGRTHANTQRRVIRNRATKDYSTFVENSLTGSNDFWVKVAYLRDQQTSEVKPEYMTKPTPRENRSYARTRIAPVAGMPNWIDVQDSERWDPLTIRRVPMYEALYKQNWNGAYDIQRYS